MKILELLSELEQMIDSGNTIPFSTKSLVNSEDALEIIDEIKKEMPKELVEAREIVAKKNEILVEAQNDADTIRADAEKRLKQMIDTNEITRTATQQAEAILENAQTSAREIRIGTHHYTDKVLYNLQVQLKQLNDTIEANRKELKIMK